ncbi:hypothetical protein MMC11_002996 [Xylographa trunciseda]|nr:hypothetical protein [Xylographa trunciseda]
MVTHGSLACQPAADDNFGPVVDACTRSFDFTLLFEQSILSAAPTAVFLILSLWRIWKLRISSHKTKYSWMSIAKPAAALALILGQIILLALYSRPSTIKTRLSIPATVLNLSAAMTVLPLSRLEHTRSVRPSTLLTSYLGFSIMLDVPQARTVYLIPGQLDLAATFSTAMAVKAALLLFESWSKRVLLQDQYCSLATETTSGIFGRSLFLWMNSLFVKGFARVISFDDLGPIDSKLGSARLHQNFCAEWEVQDRDVKWPLLHTLWRALRWSILSPVPPRLCYGGFLFAQPFLINRATAYLSSSSGTVEDDIGYGLVAAAGFTYLGIAVRMVILPLPKYKRLMFVNSGFDRLV